MQCKILSKDHTFKAAASINFMKDGQWVKQYDSLYCAKYKKGMVMAFHKSERILQNIDSGIAEMEVIFTDNS